MEEKLNFEKMEAKSFEKYSDLVAAYRVYLETSHLGREDLAVKIQAIINDAEHVWGQVENALSGNNSDDAKNLRFRINEYRAKVEEIKNACGLESAEPNA